MLSNFQDRSEVLERVLADIAREPVLPAEVEADLARRAAAGDDEAASQLVLANLHRVVHLSRGYRAKGLPMEDVIHEGIVGLLEAIRHFDADRGVRLFTYASFWVHRTIVAALARSTKVVRVPRQVAAKARRQREESPSPEHATEARATASYEVSLDRPPRRRAPWRYPDPLATRDAEASIQGAVLADEELQELSAALALLPDRDRRVVEARFGLNGQAPGTLRDVGARLELSKERVRQIETRALDAIRERLRQRWGLPLDDGGHAAPPPLTAAVVRPIAAGWPL